MKPAQPVSAYLDANIYVGLYAYSDADLNELEKLGKAAKDGQLQLFLPTQTDDEISRNREKAIADAIKQFSSERSSAKLPLLMSGLTGVEEYKAAFQELERRRARLLTEARKLTSDRQLHADKLIADLRSIATSIDSSKLYLPAIRRHHLRNPPGKGSGVGDEVNWETLLEHCPDGDLHLVSKDGDYASPLDSNKPRSFLADEWRARKKGQVYLHKDVSSFLGTLNVHIKLEAEQNKARAVEAFVDSGSYRTTHLAISDLSPYINLLDASDAKAIFEAGVANSQIADILGDSDVESFYRELLQRFGPDSTEEAKVIVRKLG